jgi:hypothetical protein
MIKIVISLTLGICCFVTGMFAQQKDADLKRFQKVLKKTLLDAAPNIADIEHKQCRIVLKTSSGAVNDRSAISRGTPVAGGNFPKSEANVYLSSGADTDTIIPTVYETFQIELAELTSRSITIIPSNEKAMSRIVLIAETGTEAIQYKHGSKMERLPRISFAVKAKSAEKAATAISDVISQCKRTKDNN